METVVCGPSSVVQNQLSTLTGFHFRTVSVPSRSLAKTCPLAVGSVAPQLPLKLASSFSGCVSKRATYTGFAMSVMSTIETPVE